MAFANTSLMKTPTMLEQLLEEINFQRTKEMRQLLKDDSGFVMLQGTTYWTDLFVRHFLFQNESTIDCDDLLFFVRKKHVKSSSRYLPKFETEVDVFRKDSRKLPIGDPDIDWEETVYLNLIIHQFDYTLTLAICTRTSPKELQVLRRHSQKVYASPSRRRMDTKGEVEEMTYPHICFMVDNFDEVFCDILVRDGEMVCVELVASDRQGAIQGVIFLGSIRYDALKKVYDSRQSSLSTKMAQRMTFGLFSSGAAQRCEFVRMKGPQGKGHAEMAVTKPKGSGVETPTSEPGYCLTDMWDSDWDSDPEEWYASRMQRRLSDPSANLNTFVRGGWRSRGPGERPDGLTARAWSENEGLDCIDTGVSEIEAGDVRDDVTSVHEPASSSHTSDCCCWRRRDSLSIMSEVYSRPHHRDTATAVSFRTVLDRVEVAADATSVRDRPIGAIETNRLSASDFGAEQDFEFADDAISLNEDVCAADDDDDGPNKNSDRTCASNDEKTHRYANLDPESVITVDGKEELPSPEQFHRRVADVGRLKPDGCGRRTTKHAKRANNKTKPNRESNALSSDDGDVVKACNGAKIQNGSLENVEIKIWARDDINNFNSDDKNRNRLDARDGVRLVSKVRHYCTLPKRKRGTANSKSWYRAALAPPHRVTPDGTDIYYWCDMPKKIIDGELDDGQYNPLWTMRGFTQTFHFWKENKRAQSVPLNAFLTYVTLPWWSIAKDILDHREGPILTF